LATCVIGRASSSPSISISFIGVLIHLISISILLDNYVIINSKSDMTQKKIYILSPSTTKQKDTFPSELVYLPTLLLPPLSATKLSQSSWFQQIQEIVNRIPSISLPERTQCRQGSCSYHSSTQGDCSTNQDHCLVGSAFQ